jgi:hypothetical protein
MMAADGIFLAALAVMTGCTLYFAPRIGRERIAMQWGFDGRPTWSMPKPVGLWALIAFAVAVRLFIAVLLKVAPDRVHGEEPGLSLFSIIVAVCHAAILFAAAKPKRSVD